jgi:hypothetical protein
MVVLAPLSAAAFGRISEQASMTVDMGKFSVLATLHQPIPSARSLRAFSRPETVAWSLKGPAAEGASILEFNAPDVRLFNRPF